MIGISIGKRLRGCAKRGWEPVCECDNSYSHVRLIGVGRSVLKRAWSTDYTGSAANRLVDMLDRTAREFQHCSNTSLIQSAGTGKSRMLWEASKMVFTIPFSLGINVKKGQKFYK